MYDYVDRLTDVEKRILKVYAVVVAVSDSMPDTKSKEDIIKEMPTINGLLTVRIQNHFVDDKYIGRNYWYRLMSSNEELSVCCFGNYDGNHPLNCVYAEFKSDWSEIHHYVFADKFQTDNPVLYYRFAKGQGWYGYLRSDKVIVTKFREENFARFFHQFGLTYS